MDKKRPGALTAIAIVGIILGSLGTCAGISSIASTALQGRMQAFSRQMADASSMGNDDVLQRQLALQERVNAISEQWRPALLGQQLLNLLASLVLLVGGILLLRGKPSAPRLLIAAAIASVVIDGGGGVMTVLYQLELGTAMEAYFAELANDPMLAGAGSSMTAIGTAGTRAGMFFGIAWVLVKLGFYTFMIVRLRKPDVRALFEPPAPPAPVAY